MIPRPQTAMPAPIPAFDPGVSPLDEFVVFEDDAGFVAAGGLVVAVLADCPLNGTKTPFQLAAQSLEDGEIDASWSRMV